MNRMNRLNIIAVLLPLISCAASACGYGTESESSLEWNLANADRVVHGRVVAVHYEVRHEPYILGPAKDLWRVQTVRVSETLKGPPVEELVIASPWLSDVR